MRFIICTLTLGVLAASALQAQTRDSLPAVSGAASAKQQTVQHQRTRAGVAAPADAKPRTGVPSIIQSELARSRAEEKQQKAPVSAPAVPASSTPLWPVFIAVLIAGCATASIVYFFFLRKHARFQRTPAPPAPQTAPAAPAAGIHAPAADPQHHGEDRAPSAYWTEEDVITSAAPYAYDEDSEMPEAALTMNLLNKKRESKKELIQEVMRRVQRKEKPQQIAEALHVGIGEVQLAMTLAKLKK